MAKPKVDLNSKEIEKLLKGREVQAELKRRVGRAAAAAGPGFEADVTVGRTRALGKVAAVTPAARRRNAKDHTLMRVRDELR